MSSPPTFTLFPHLLPEIRLQVWEDALQPRIITFSCSISGFNVRKAPQALYLVGGDPPYSHFTMNVPQRPTSPYYIIQSYPRDVASPPLLSTCHESRDVALRHGYKAWRIESEKLGTRQLMWNPKLDVISLAKVGKSLYIDEQSLDIFTSLFPEQTREIQRLVVESEHCYTGWTRMHECDWPRVLEFSSLVELVALVDPITRRTVGLVLQGIEDLIDTTEKKSKIELEVAARAVSSCLALAKERRLSRMKGGSTEYGKLDRWFPERIRVVGYEDHVLNEE